MASSRFQLVTKLRGVVAFDAVLSESYDHTAEITRHEVEDGLAITDHIRVLPDSFSITAVNVDDALYEKLLSVFNARDTVDVITAKRAMRSYGIETMGVTRDGTTGQALNYSLTFVQIRTPTIAFNTITPKDPARAESEDKGANPQPINFRPFGRDGDDLRRATFGGT